MLPPRSALYLPASNARAIAKARTLPCDAVILDLEDAVAPEHKVRAREAAVAAARDDWGARTLVVRVNALASAWGRDDLAVVRDAGFAAVLIPKPAAADLRACRAALGPVPLWIMVETCRALLDLPALAAASAAHGVTAWVLGSNDLALELGLPSSDPRPALAPVAALVIAAARVAGAVVLDGVWNAIADETGFVADAHAGWRAGFDGKTLIHPSQIAPCHAVWTPAAAELAAARAIVAAFAAAPVAGVLSIEGRMVERLHLTQAERLLARAR